MSAILRSPGKADTSNLTGIVCVTAATIAFTLNDVGIKWLSGDYPLHQLTFFRSLIALVITAALFVPFEGSFTILRTRRPYWHIVRGLLVITANMAFFVGVATIPLADATAIYFVAPLFITAFSVILLGEKVGWRRWIAVSIGFGGVLLVIQPGGASFQYAALLPLVAAAVNALLHISTRKLSLTERASTMAFYIQLVFMVFSLLFGIIFGDGKLSGTGNANLEFLFRPWIWPASDDLGIIALTGMFCALATFLISQGYRLSQAGIAAPFEYVGIPLSVLLGILLWGDWPAPLAWGGILLIVLSGLYVLMRETLQGQLMPWKRPWRRTG